MNLRGLVMENSADTVYLQTIQFNNMGTDVGTATEDV